MGITYNTFGVTVNDVKGRVHSLGIAVATSPNTTDVTAMIVQAASEIAGECFASGITVDGMEDTSAEYMILKNAVLNKTVADLLVARQRGGDAPYFIRLYEKAIAGIIRRRPQVLNQTDAGPNKMKSVLEMPDADLATFNDSIVGKIVNGGF